MPSYGSSASNDQFQSIAETYDRAVARGTVPDVLGNLQAPSNSGPSQYQPPRPPATSVAPTVTAPPEAADVASQVATQQVFGRKDLFGYLHRNGHQGNFDLNGFNSGGIDLQQIAQALGGSPRNQSTTKPQNAQSLNPDMLDQIVAFLAQLGQPQGGAA